MKLQIRYDAYKWPFGGLYIPFWDLCVYIYVHMYIYTCIYIITHIYVCVCVLMCYIQTRIDKGC